MNRTRSLLLFLFLNRLGAYKMEFSNSHTNVNFTTSPPYRKINLGTLLCMFDLSTRKRSSLRLKYTLQR